MYSLSFSVACLDESGQHKWHKVSFDGRKLHFHGHRDRRQLYRETALCEVSGRGNGCAKFLANWRSDRSAIRSLSDKSTEALFSQVSAAGFDVCRIVRARNRRMPVKLKRWADAAARRLEATGKYAKTPYFCGEVVARLKETLPESLLVSSTKVGETSDELNVFADKLHIVTLRRFHSIGVGKSVTIALTRTWTGPVDVGRSWVEIPVTINLPNSKSKGNSAESFIKALNICQMAYWHSIKAVRGGHWSRSLVACREPPAIDISLGMMTYRMYTPEAAEYITKEIYQLASHLEKISNLSKIRYEKRKVLYAGSAQQINGVVPTTYWTKTPTVPRIET
jgi:hypothetical protein